MNRKYLVAAALLIGSVAPLFAQSVKTGIESWQRGDYAGAVATWRPLAEKGDADAQFNLGQAYRLGRGVSPNLSAAKTWFERAATQGHIDAQTTLGLLLFQNGDQAEGLKWLKKAAEQGDPRALLVYGTALVNGDSVAQDRVLGYAYVSRAAAQGLGPAKQTLAQLDQVLPLADRKKGVAFARKLAQAAPAPTSTPKIATTKPAPQSKRPAVRPSEAVAATASKAPPRPSATVANAGIAPSNGPWRIQLGAFSQRGSAEALYARLAGRPALAARRAFYIQAGAITRLQAGPFESKAAADAACRTLGVACFAVPAK
jgi:cell division septation protein DedD